MSPAAPGQFAEAPPPPGEDRDKVALRRLRALILAALVFGMLGTLAELWLLEHYEDGWQTLPLYLLAAGPLAVAWFAARPGAASRGVLLALMLVYVVSGAIGTWQHYSGNAEFELEMYPTRAGFELFWESLKGATPALAPGTMALLGFLGMAAAAVGREN